jgi:hypothetical protein
LSPRERSAADALLSLKDGDDQWTQVDLWLGTTGVRACMLCTLISYMYFFSLISSSVYLLARST